MGVGGRQRMETGNSGMTEMSISFSFFNLKKKKNDWSVIDLQSCLGDVSCLNRSGYIGVYSHQNPSNSKIGAFD